MVRLPANRNPRARPPHLQNAGHHSRDRNRHSDRKRIANSARE